MRDLLLVARHEYRVMVGRRAFIISTVALPLVLALIIGGSILLAEGALGSAEPIGYVDQAGLLSETPTPEHDEERIPVVRFADVAAGRAAVEAGEVRALFVVPGNVLESLRFDVYYWDQAPGDAVWSRWNGLVRRGLLARQPEEVRERILEGTDATVRSLGGREFREGDVIGLLTPIAAALLFTVASAMSSGYLLQALVGEKENRTMEVLVSSVAPTQLIGGKALGLMGVALTQLGIWILTVAVALVVGRPWLGDIPPVRMPWDLLAAVAAFFVPSYALLAGTMIGVSGLVGDTRQAQAVAGPLTLPFMLPITLMPLVFSNPQSPALTVLTLLPLTSFMTVIMRVGFGQLPFWQISLSWVLLVSTALGSIWLASAIFRRGMLRYGQRLSLRQALASVRGRGVRG